MHVRRIVDGADHYGSPPDIEVQGEALCSLAKSGFMGTYGAARPGREAGRTSQSTGSRRSPGRFRNPPLLGAARGAGVYADLAVSRIPGTVKFISTIRHIQLARRISWPCAKRAANASASRTSGSSNNWRPGLPKARRTSSTRPSITLGCAPLNKAIADITRTFPPLLA